MFLNNNTNELDKLAIIHNTDKKPGFHNYTKQYFHYFSQIRNEPIKLLEIGVQNGNSHRMWQEFFPQAKIYGIDIDKNCKKHEDERISIYIGDQKNKKFLKKISQEIEPLEIIIDDGGHTMKQQKTSFEVLFPYVKKGGVYVVEDLHTSYWREYTDCFCLDSPTTMVSYIKNLIDSVNFIGATTKKADTSTKLPKGVRLHGFEKYAVENIQSVHIYSSLCFIFKK